MSLSASEFTTADLDSNPRLKLTSTAYGKFNAVVTVKMKNYSTISHDSAAFELEIVDCGDISVKKANPTETTTFTYNLFSGKTDKVFDVTGRFDVCDAA